MAAVVMAHAGDDAIQLARTAGPTFAHWAGGLWLAFTVYPAKELYACVIDSATEDTAIDELVALAHRTSDALDKTVHPSPSRPIDELTRRRTAANTTRSKTI